MWEKAKQFSSNFPSAVGIQCSQIYIMVTAIPPRTPPESRMYPTGVLSCPKSRAISTRLAASICSAKFLQSKVVNKGCVEFVEAAKQRRCDHSCLRCTSAAVMLTPWTQQEKSKHMRADIVFTASGSLHTTAQVCPSKPTNLHPFRILNCLSD